MARGCYSHSEACIESGYFIMGLLFAGIVGAATWDKGLFVSLASAGFTLFLCIVFGKFIVMLVLLLVAYCLIMGTFFHDKNSK